jgi:hypothetical protein
LYFQPQRFGVAFHDFSGNRNRDSPIRSCVALDFGAAHRHV